ncbi:hypothetical protein BJ138DRAFT_1159480 [Hygrophoropsis aurantiaca]|uniref:Uncharacterized protein n=1 Tax=Hygrophoropsis aurantiaca TaxID=72124 RepID=A0ACB8A2Y9_9AGAM|nr:hypothetical protein BJ138DRAFT_1159480 [Hygrophoropsis aurantiaca]
MNRCHSVPDESHHSHSELDSDYDTPRRYRRREWKRNKPHLPRSDSLPNLHLHPRRLGRPLFTCARCGFANALIPLCLWCAWTSEEATRAYERGLPRVRRLSAPARVSVSAKVQPPSMMVQPPSPGRPRTSVDSSKSSAGPATPPGDMLAFSVPGITAVLEGKGGEPKWDADATTDYNDNLKANVKGCCRVVREVVTATQRRRAATVGAEPQHPPTQYPPTQSTGIRHRRRLPALFLRMSRSRASHATAYDATSEHSHSLFSLIAPTSNTINEPNLCQSNACSQLHLHATHPHVSPYAPAPHSALSSASSLDSPKRILRRKERMPLLKRNSSQSPCSRTRTPSPLAQYTSCGPSNHADAPSSREDPTRSSQFLSTASITGFDPPARLGHPSRPYYSAIRKNMSRPTSPTSPVHSRPTSPGLPASRPISPVHPSSRAASPGFPESPVYSRPSRTASPVFPEDDYEFIPRATKSLDCARPLEYSERTRPMSMEYAYTRPTSMEYTRPLSPPFSGFSLSGETELRMALAKLRHEDALDEMHQYVYHETHVQRGRGKVRMKDKVKKLGQGLRGLVRGHAAPSPL